MINFRFHLVSLVAVFLALGVGVAMGASFVDRATVETLRNRLDQLEGNYRERGTEIDALHDHLRATDEATAALLAEGSAVLGGRLADREVVVIAPADLPAGALDAAWAALTVAGAGRSGTLTIEPAIDLADEGVLASARELLELDSAAPSLVRGRLLSRLATSLAALTATPIDPPPAGTPEAETPTGEPGATTTSDPGATTTSVPASTTTTLPLFRPLGPRPTDAEVADAREFLRAAADAGLVSIDTGDATGGEFPEVVEVTYVMLVADDLAEGTVPTLHRLAGEIAEVAPVTVTVAETGTPHDPGTLPDGDPDRRGAMLVDLRSDDDTVDRLSTVDSLDEAVGRITLVLAVEEQLAGRVGHYGSGTGATAAVPRAEG